MTKVASGDLNGFIRSHNIHVTGEIKALMKIGCELGYLYDEDLIYMAGANEHDAQRRLTTRRRSGY